MTSIWPEWLTFVAPSGNTPEFYAGRKNAVRDVAREILGAISGIALLGPKDGVVWRGQADESWRLESKASRAGLLGEGLRWHEEAMLADARKVGADNAQYMGDWEILARMRHHGAATRLIDCTTDPFVALWFLCEDAAHQAADGVLLALQRSQFRSIKRPHDANYSTMFSHEGGAARLMYSTPPIDRRIAAQRGMFVLHSDPFDRNAAHESELGAIEVSNYWRQKHLALLEKVCGTSHLAAMRGQPVHTFPTMLAISVPAGVKDFLLGKLNENFGFERTTIYPDFAGLGQVYSLDRTEPS